MRQFLRWFSASIAVSLLIVPPLSRAYAEDSKVPAQPKSRRSQANEPTSTTGKPTANQDPLELNLLDAMRQGTVSVQAEGSGDGRMTMSLTNRSSRTLRVVLPPGIVAQGATGQFGGMGGMGMGGMGGGMMGGMGGGMGGMGGGMGGMGGMRGGGMGGMGGMGRMAATMPPMMGMMMLSRMIMYFCGDVDTWDMRSLMIGMGRMGGMGMGGMGMGGMGMGGMGMGGMGMRSVPPTSLPFAELQPRQTRHLPTRLVSLSPPDPQTGVRLPQKGEPLQIGDISDFNENPRVQKALKRLAADKASSPTSQLIMWHLAAGLDWETIAQLSQPWANRYQLTLAQKFVEHLDTLPEGEAGRVQFQVTGTDSATEPMAAELIKVIQGKTVLGLRAETIIPTRPEGPSVGCRVRLSSGEALVQVVSSDAAAQTWIPFGKFTLPARLDHGKFDAARLADALTEGLLNRLVRTQLLKGPREKSKLTYRIRIDNASPLILNGLAALGVTSQEDVTPRVLSGVSIPPRRSMTVPASEDVVRALGLKNGIRIVAIDLSAL
jgi:hypothetical protein